MYHYLLNLLVFQFHVGTLPYFMDECTMWEVIDLIEGIKWMDRNTWEQTRLQSYLTVQVNSKNKLTPSDLIHFPWDEGIDNTDHDTEISNEDIQRLKELGKKWVSGYTTQEI